MNEIKKRKREKPNKKWTEEDIIKILNYLQAAPAVEAPTAQIFYKKLIEMTAIDATWELIRWKVRHLKSLFKKANDWRKSTGAGLLETGAGISCVEGKVLQLCPHYKELNEIFGDNKNKNTHIDVIDSGDATIMDETTLLFGEIETMYSVENGVTLPPEMSEKQSTPSTTPKKAKYFAEKIKKYPPKSSASHLAAFQAERTEMFKIKLEWEKEKHEKDLALQDRKLRLEEEKIKAEIENRKREFDLKALKLEKEERLKILEIEKDERLQRYELEMKYKCKFQK